MKNIKKLKEQTQESLGVSDKDLQPRELAELINQKAEDIVDLLIGQKLKVVRMIIGRVEDKVAELYLVN